MSPSTLLLVALLAPDGDPIPCLKALTAAATVDLRGVYLERCLPLVEDAACRDALVDLGADARAACAASTPRWARAWLAETRAERRVSRLVELAAERPEPVSASLLVSLVGQLLATPVMVEVPPKRPDRPPPEPLRVRVTLAGTTLSAAGAAIPCDCGTAEALRATLRRLKQTAAWRDRRDAVIEVDAQVPYARIIEVMDALRGPADGAPLFPNIALATTPPPPAR